MKTLKILASALMLGAAIACAPKQEAATTTEGEATASTNPKDFTPTKAQKDSVSYLIGVNFGSFIKGYNFGDDLNYALIEKGIKDFVKAKGNPRDSNFVKQFKINPETMNTLFNKYLEQRANYTKALNVQKENEFLAKNAKKSGVQVTESGLQYTIIEAGNDVKPGPMDTVLVHYKGTLTNGNVFDQTPEGSAPIELVMNQVVAGWTEGLQLIGEGGKINLVLPSKLGYGERGTNGIEPNSVLLFEVTLDAVKKVAE